MDLHMQKSQEKQLNAQEQEQKQLASEQLLDDYAQKNVGGVTREQVQSFSFKTNDEMRFVQAEQLRMGFAVEEQEPVKLPPDVPEQPEATYAKLSWRQRRKLKSRQENEKANARRRGYQNPTSDTLAMSREIEKRNAEEPRDMLPMDWKSYLAEPGFLLNLFTPSVEYRRDTMLDIPAILEQLRVSEAVLAKARQPDEPLSLEEQAQAAVLEQLVASAKETLRVTFGSSGVDAETGAALSQEARDACQEAKGRAVRTYRQNVWKRDDLFLDNVEAMSGEAMTQIEAAVRQEEETAIAEKMTDETDTAYYERVKQLNFAFSDYDQTRDYIDSLKLIDQNPEAYAARREALDKIFADYTTCERKRADIARKLKQITALGTGDNAQYSKQTAEHLRRRLLQSHELRTVTQRSELLRSAMRCLLSGEQADAHVHYTLEKTYDVVTDQRAQTKDRLKQIAIEEKQRERAHLAQLEEKLRLTGEIFFEDNEQETAQLISGRIKLLIDARHNVPVDISQTRLDQRALSIFAPSYQTNPDGTFLTEQDAAGYDICKRYYEDMTSGNQELIRPHLDRITAKLLSYVPTPEMSNSEYILQNAVSMKQACDEMCYAENLMKDFAWYFDQLPMRQRKHLHLVGDLYSNLGIIYNNYCRSIGVESNDGRLLDANKRALRMQAQESYEEFARGFYSKVRTFEDYTDRLRRFSLLDQSARQRTPEEREAHQTAYCRQSQLKYAERNACMEIMREQMTPAGYASFLTSNEYARVTFRMDAGMGRDVNLARLRSEILFWRHGSKMQNASAPEDIAHLLPYYNQIKEGIKLELLNILNFADSLDLTYDEILDRAEEIARTEMSIMHLSDIGRMVNPETKVPLTEELIGADNMLLFRVLNEKMVAYKCAIRGSGTGADDHAMKAHPENYVIANNGYGPLETTLREFDKYDLKRGEDSTSYARYKERLASGWRPVMPEDTPPSLYARRN